MEHPITSTHSYKSKKAAKSALTKMLKNNKYLKGIRTEYKISEYEFYQENIEKYVIVKSLVGGKEICQSVNTPRCCDPSTELYWNM